MPGASVWAAAELTGLPAHQIAAHGLVRTFQVARVFDSLSVRDNLLLPFLAAGSPGGLATGLARAGELLALATLERLPMSRAGTLSGGQRMLLQACAGFMVPACSLYVLDEPFAGINPVVKDTLIGLIRAREHEPGSRLPDRQSRDGYRAPAVPDRLGHDRGRGRGRGHARGGGAPPRGDRRLFGTSRGMTAPMLEVTGLRAGLSARRGNPVRRVAAAAAENAVTLVIGPNGAGKSTLLRTIFGLLPPRAGRVRLRGKDVTGAGPSRLKAAGVSYITQDINSFPLLTVEENLLMGAWIFRRDRTRIARQLEQRLCAVSGPEGQARATAPARSRAARAACSRWRAS